MTEKLFILMLLFSFDQAYLAEREFFGTQYRQEDGSYIQVPSKAEFVWVYDSVYENCPEELDFIFFQRCQMKYQDWRNWYLSQEANKSIEIELEKFNDGIFSIDHIAVDASR